MNFCLVGRVGVPCRVSVRRGVCPVPRCRATAFRQQSSKSNPPLYPPSHSEGAEASKLKPNRPETLVIFRLRRACGLLARGPAVAADAQK